MTQDTRDEADLEWFFREARGDCGLRSTLGGTIFALEQMDHRHTRQKHEPGEMYVRKRKPSARVSDDAAVLRMIDTAARANRIGNRLRRIGERHEHVLRAQYGDDGGAVMISRVDGVAVGLLCTMSLVRHFHSRALEVLSRRNDEAKARRRIREIVTPAMWIAWLVAKAKSDEGAAEMLSQILRDGRQKLAAALVAYSETGGTDG